MTKQDKQTDWLPPPVAWAVLPAWHAGAKDSLNPGSLTGVLVFAVLLWLVLKKGWPFSVCVFPYILGNAVTALCSAAGVWDHMLNTRAADIFHDVAYMTISLAAIVLGLVLVRDWWAVKRSGGDTSRALVHLTIARKPKRKPGKGTRAKRFAWGGLLFVVFLAGGGLMGAVETAWAPDVYTAYIIQDLSSPGGMFSGLRDLMFYSLGYVLPLLVLGLMAFAERSGGAVARFVERRLTVMQILTAGIFLAYGSTIIFRYYL